ncbi:MAG: tetratricopeptide repeat protein [Candidatus Zixiibacteriota bacterium]
MALKDTPETIPSPPADQAPSATGQDPAANSKRPADVEDDNLDFVVTEAHGDDHELVGGFKSSGADNLGIETPADLMDAEASSVQDSKARHRQYTDVLAGQADWPNEADMFAETGPLEVPAARDRNSEPNGGFERLSDAQVQEISRRMRAEASRSGYLSEEEKQKIVSGIGVATVGYGSEADPSARPRGTGFHNEPIIPPKRAKDSRPITTDFELMGDSPKISKRSRGIAYFAKGYIQVTGQQELHDGDELVISGREYVLRKKKLSNKAIMVTVGSLAAIVVFTLGMLFSSSAEIGAGRLVGVVLDQSGQPILTGGKVQLPELGHSYDINGQGLFKSDRLDAGSYKLEFVVGQQVIASDYATVTDNNITTIVLKPTSHVAIVPAEQQTSEASPRGGFTAHTAEPETRPVENQPPRPAAVSAPVSRPTPPPAASFARLTLAANVDNARLSIDGSVIGAGNLTYSQLKPGIHKYTVSRDGYQDATGIIDLKTDETNTLKVTLEPSSVQTKPRQRAELEYYQSALSAIDRGDLSSGLNDLNQAIAIDPSYSKAYVKRGEIYRHLRNNGAAHDDFVRAAEIFQMNNEPSQALAAYEDALKANSKSVPAYLGRGSLYLARNEAIAALADFDMVTRLDKRNLDGYIGLGRARYNQGNFDKAEKHFRDARSLEPNNPVIHQYLMLSHFGMGEFKEVQKDYEKFLKCASEAQITQIKTDPRFAPVLRVIEN